MARKKVKPRSYFEPWRVAKSTLHGPRPNVEGIPEDAGRTILEKWDRIDEHADWVLWGSRMATPCVVTGLASGKPQVMNDERIIAVRRWLSLPEGSPSHEDVAKRIAECVNALVGVADPVAFVAEVRALLLSYARGEGADDPRTDVRVVSLLGRCIPPEELEQFDAGFQD